MQRLRTIFASFFKIGLFTFGGGYAMLPLIEQELIAKRGWIEHKEFFDLLTLAQSVPGPIAINTSVFVGYKMRGLKGAVAALLGSAPAVVRHHPRNRPDVRRHPSQSGRGRGLQGHAPGCRCADRGAGFFARARHALVDASSSRRRPSPYGSLGWSPIYILIAAAAIGISWTLLITKKAKK